jgi:hypothetical protein
VLSKLFKVGDSLEHSLASWVLDSQVLDDLAHQLFDLLLFVAVCKSVLAIVFH